MLRSLLIAAVAALALAPTATADGGAGPGVLQGGPGVRAPSGKIRYVAIPGARTTVEVVRTTNGEVLTWRTYRGSWGIPQVAFDGSRGGLSHDGRTLVLGEAARPPTALRSQTRFLVIDTKRLQVRQTVKLNGDFAFDAVSPDGRKLYLIQHVSAANVNRYVVRAYDLGGRRLLPGRIADRTQRGWVMQGYPVTRLTSGGGRWAYTLYQNPGGYPFVHALDTVRGVAHCIGIPWTGNQNALFRTRLSLRDGGRVLELTGRGGRPLHVIDTRTYRVRQPTVSGDGSGNGFPWWALGIGIAGALVMVGAVVARTLHRPRPAAPSEA